MADRDEEEDIETMVADRQMLQGLEAQRRGLGQRSSAPPHSPAFPAGLIKTMPMAPPAPGTPGGEPVLAEEAPEGTPQIVVNFLLVCGVITAFGLMTLIYLKI